MNTNIPDFNTFVEQSRKAFGPVVELGELTARTMEDIARQQFDAVGDYVDFQTRQFQLLGQVRDMSNLSEVMSEETRLAAEFGEKVKGYAEGLAKTATDAQKAYSDWATTAFQIPAVMEAPKPRARKKAA